MNFTDFYGVSVSSSSDSWTEFQIPHTAMSMEQGLLNHIPSSSNTPFLAPALPPLLDISLNGGTAAAASTHPVAPDPPHKKARLTSHGAPKPKERELYPEEDIPTTAADAVVRCRWGNCEETFCAGAWTAHAKRHRTEMQGTRDRAGHAKCLWRGCGARLMPGSMGKHVRAQHVGTYEVRCKYCGKTARADSYVGTHGLARDCPLRPGPSRTSTTPSASASATPTLSPSRGSSTLSDGDSLPGPSRYSRCRLSDTSPASPDSASSGCAPSVLPLLAKSLRDRRQQSARDVSPEVLAAEPPNQPTTDSDTVQPLALFHPRPVRRYQLLGFDLSAPPPLVPDVPTFYDTPTDPESSPLEERSTVRQPPSPCVLAADVPVDEIAFYHVIANMNGLDVPFVFDPDVLQR
ncbi:hypothetical protein V8D89_002479 [Ganoderma adspersum]